MNMRKTIFGILLLLSLALWGVPVRGQGLHQIIDSLNRRSVYSTYWDNGWGGLVPEWVYQDLLGHMAPIKTLIAIVKQQNFSPPLRLSAMWALIDQKLPVCKAVVLYNMNDSSLVTVQSADVIYGDYTQNLYIEWLMQGRSEGWVSAADSMQIDSAALCSPVAARLDYTRRLLHRLPPGLPEYEQRVRQLYVREHIAEALPLLASYRREADKPLILTALRQYAQGLDKKGAQAGRKGHTNEALLAVRNWPDEAFKTTLLAIRDYEVRRKYYDYARIKYLFEALMAYDSPWAYRQIDLTLRKNRKNDYYREYFHSAMKKHYNARYQRLLDKWPYKPWNDFGDGFE
ncbi:hypothetical protein [Prevotella sp. KH2C16]|uniref:hypothetical protein n=1 Tax=Prevotella sp. KH2C16 TaxID=1855325 RepID=UPI001160CE52|nr:hypothetical protein [Prevotella sp. KH2C16]